MFYASSNNTDLSKAKDVGALLDELCIDTAKAAAAATAAGNSMTTPIKNGNKTNNINNTTRSSSGGLGVSGIRQDPNVHTHDQVHTLSHDIFEDLGLRAPSPNSATINNVISRFINPQLPFLTPRPDEMAPSSTLGVHSATCSPNEMTNGTLSNGLRGLDAQQPFIRVLHPKFGGQVSFKSFREAALCILLMDGTPLLDFVKWAADMKSQIEKDPRCVPKNEFWRFFLLHDQSLATPSRQIPVTLATNNEGVATGEPSSAAEAVFSSTSAKVEPGGAGPQLPYRPVKVTSTPSHGNKVSKSSSTSNSRRDSFQKVNMPPIKQEDRSIATPGETDYSRSLSAKQNGSNKVDEEVLGEDSRLNGGSDATTAESYISQRSRSPMGWRNSSATRASGSDNQDCDDDEEEEVIGRHHKRRHIRRHIAR